MDWRRVQQIKEVQLFLCIGLKQKRWKVRGTIIKRMLRQINGWTETKSDHGTFVKSTKLSWKKKIWQKKKAGFERVKEGQISENCSWERCFYHPRQVWIRMWEEEVIEGMAISPKRKPDKVMLVLTDKQNDPYWMLFKDTIFSNLRLSERLFTKNSICSTRSHLRRQLFKKFEEIQHLWKISLTIINSKS